MSNEIDIIKIAVVGDVHDRWGKKDGLALKHLEVDLVLFVGDFGNESVDVVRKVAAIDIPKAVILGNHDAWYTASWWGQKRAPYDRTKEDRVKEQLELLGESHVGYGKLDFPQFNLSVVGGRPFSWGGSEWKNPDFYRDRYNINNFAESTDKIIAAAQATTQDNLIFIGHNGPTGLGDRPEDTCGKDWEPIGGDHGDPDFAQAIDKVQSLGKSIPLVTFGHMHHKLRHRQDRLRTIVNTSPEGTIYFNSACVPRIKGKKESKRRSFSLVTLDRGKVKQIALIWLQSNFDIVSEEILFPMESSSAKFSAKSEII